MGGRMASNFLYNVLRPSQHQGLATNSRDADTQQADGMRNVYRLCVGDGDVKALYVP